jgi:multiple sugar transport system substrate-binding protein
MAITDRRPTRRSVLKGSAAVAGSGLLGTSLGGGLARAQDSTTFSREASIVSWGFGAEETNPMAYSRINAFRETYPNIQIELVPQFEDQKLLTAFASKQLPDLLWMGRDKVASWAARDVLMPLDEMLDSGRIDMSQIYPVALEDVKYDGQTYGFPQFMDVRTLYLNLDALADAELDANALDTGNWDQLAQFGAALVKKNGEAVERWGFDHKIQAGWLWLWARANGGRLMSDDGTEVTFDDPEAVEALEWGKRVYDEQGGFQLYESVATTWQGDEQFARGQVGMTMYENWMLGIVARVAPDLNFKIVPVKQRGGQDSISFTGGPAWCIPNGAKDPEAAFEFITFMAQVETWTIGARAVKEAREAEGAPYIPSLTGNQVADQRQIEELYEPLGGPYDEAVQLFPQLLQSSFSLPVSKSPAGNEVTDILKTDAVMPALRGEVPPAEALTTADQNAQDAIDFA